MKTWTPDAADHFEAWLGRARTSVAADPSVDPDDIAQDLRAHVHAELAATPEPVTRGALEQVLDSLGNPVDWTDAARPRNGSASRLSQNVGDALMEWQLRLGGDWGLPVAVFIMTLVAIPTFPWIGAPLLVCAYVLARAHVTFAPERVVGRRRWLVYFPLAIGAGLLAGLVLGFPLTFRGQRMGGPVFQFETLWVLGSWWVLVGVLAAREPRRVRSALRPFADGFDATHARVLTLIGAAFLIASSIVGLAR